MLKSTADYPPVAFKSNSDPPTISPKPIVLKSTSHSESSSPRTEFLKTPSHSLTTSPRPVMLKSTAGSRPTILTSTPHSESSSPRPQVLKTPSRSLSTTPGPPPSYSPTTSPSPSNSLPQCISALPQEASFALPAEATLSLQSPEEDSLTLPVHFHPFPDSPRSTDVHRSPPPPSSPPSPLLGLSDSDSLSDSLGLIPGDEDSSDEEMRECADREQDEEEQGGRSSASLQPPLSPAGDAPLSLLDSLQESPPPGLFTEPSQVSESVGERRSDARFRTTSCRSFL
ncbi:hypothetical protein NFI96_009338 [Prochilodus magdalenae]|nr:hypothetical protein NFI96_009338 [Prochilodus magdalenae]